MTYSARTMISLERALVKRTGKENTAREREDRAVRGRLAGPARHALYLVLAPLIAGCATSQSIELPSPPVGPVPLVPGPGTPRVHLQLNPPDTSYPGVELREVAGWEVEEYTRSTQISTTKGTRLVPGSRGLCPVPCGVIIDGRGDHEFFFSGPGIHPSEHFQLATETGDLLFKVNPGSQGQWRAAEFTTIAGVVLFVIGSGVLALGAASGSQDSDVRYVPGASMLGMGVLLGE